MKASQNYYQTVAQERKLKLMQHFFFTEEREGSIEWAQKQRQSVDKR